MPHVLDHLMDEHREVERLLEELKGASGDARRTAFDDLVRSLELHMAVEERFVYPLVSEHIGTEEAESASDEHELARAGIAEARRRLEDGAFEAAIEVLEAGISHHVEEGEAEIFPELRQKARGQLDAMDPDRLETEVEEGSGSGGAGDERSKDELLEEARKRDISGRSSMTKDELRDALGDG